MKNIITCILANHFFFMIYANDKIIQDHIYDPRIKTVLLHPEHDMMRNPVIELNGRESLILKFDRLSHEIENYEYTIVACNADWTPSVMFPYEYMQGFQVMPVNDFRISANINTIRYVHYWLVFPNNQLNIRKSGNYVVNVFKAGYPDSLVLTKRFMVYESLVNAEIFTQRSAISEYYDTHQELHFNVQLNRYEVQLPHNEIKVTLMQNFRWDNAMYEITPIIVNQSLLRFYRTGRYVFPAGKEYRYFDIRNLLVRNERIQSLGVTKNDTVYLYEDKPRKNESYRFFPDLNGRYLTGSYPWTNVEWEGNYVYVFFTLKTGAIYRNGDIYIIGKFSDWQAKPEYKMTYDAESKSYYAIVLLKQGIYNYMYAFVRHGSNIPDISAIEGDYFETENEYQIFIYHRPAGWRYDRLIGYKAIDSFGNERK